MNVMMIILKKVVKRYELVGTIRYLPYFSTSTEIARLIQCERLIVLYRKVKHNKKG